MFWIMPAELVAEGLDVPNHCAVIIRERSALFGVESEVILSRTFIEDPIETVHEMAEDELISGNYAIEIDHCLKHFVRRGKHVFSAIKPRCLVDVMD